MHNHIQIRFFLCLLQFFQLGTKLIHRDGGSCRNRRRFDDLLGVNPRLVTAGTARLENPVRVGAGIVIDSQVSATTQAKDVIGVEAPCGRGMAPASRCG